MKTYIVTDMPVSIGPGAKLKLDARQLAARSHLVNVLETSEGKVFVETLALVQFKVGEVFGLEGDPPKQLREALSDIATMKPEDIAAVRKRPARPAPAVKTKKR